MIRYYVADAFTDELFGGNPAGVCLLDRWIDDTLMQKIAAENNLSETAFLVRNGDAYDLRWFTPAVEVDLCGHATLASAFILDRFGGVKTGRYVFHTKSGTLTVERRDDLFEMDFPARPPAIARSRYARDERGAGSGSAGSACVARSSCRAGFGRARAYTAS